MKGDRDHLLAAARLALRGHGRAQPNPLVGCVIVSLQGEVVGWGYHERCGGPHAEIHALRRAGAVARGATAYITLAPCNHTGRTEPCSTALIQAGVARVVVAREDPNPAAIGGLEALRRAGIAAEVSDVCPEAAAVSDPFVHRVRTGLPWIIAKWAQTLDGRIATRAGESKWISGEASRRLVHRQRGRVDAILTGIGTVLRDDPLLTARNVCVRRRARRVVIDPHLKTPPKSKLIQTADEFPTTLVCAAAAAASKRAELLAQLGADIIAIDAGAAGLSMAAVARELVNRYDATYVLVEAGPGVLGRLFRERVVNEAWVFVAGLMLSDEQAVPVARGMGPCALVDGVKLRLVGCRVRCGEVALRYRAD